MGPRYEQVMAVRDQVLGDESVDRAMASTTELDDWVMPTVPFSERRCTLVADLQDTGDRKVNRFDIQVRGEEETAL